jgi:hypothetical protein
MVVRIFCATAMVLLPSLAVAQPAPMTSNGFRQLVLPAEQLGGQFDFSILLLDKTKPTPVVPGAYGHGFNSITGERLPKACVKITSVVPKAGFVAGQSGDRYFHEVSSLQAVREESKISAGASVLYSGFSLSAGGSVVNGEFHNSYGKYITAYSQILSDEFDTRGEGENGNPLLTNSAKNDAKDPVTFRAACGDHYISGYKLGGTFSAVAAVKAMVDQNWKQNQTDVSVGFKGIFGANFSQSSDYSKIRNSSSFDVRDLSVGAVPQAVSLENIYQVYNDYKALVDAKPGFVSYILTPYQALAAPELKNIPDFSFVEGAKLDELARKRDSARTISNDLIVAQDATSKGFAYFLLQKAGTPIKPEDARQEIDDFFTKIAVAADACRLATTETACTTAIDKVPAVPENFVKRAP